jgi:hypothetical protein
MSIKAPRIADRVALQSPSEEEPGVASTSYTSMQALKQDFALIDIGEFQRLLEQKGWAPGSGRNPYRGNADTCG